METRLQDSYQPSLSKCLLAELMGTFILVFFGCGVVHTSLLFEANAGLWQIAIVWGLAIMLAIYAFGSTSGCHINPAITLALTCWDGFEAKKLFPYWAAQLAGAILAAGALYVIFSGKISEYEDTHGIERSQLNGIVTASLYGEFSPTPGAAINPNGQFITSSYEAAQKTTPAAVACVCEALGTAILAFVVFSVSDDRNKGAPNRQMQAVFIGLTVSALICVFAPVTQAGFNPARDFGPRLFTYFAGWGTTALPLGTNWNWLFVYILSPLAGAVMGGGITKKFYSLH